MWTVFRRDLESSAEICVAEGGREGIRRVTGDSELRKVLEGIWRVPKDFEFCKVFFGESIRRVAEDFEFWNVFKRDLESSGVFGVMEGF